METKPYLYLELTNIYPLLMVRDRWVKNAILTKTSLWWMGAPIFFRHRIFMGDMSKKYYLGDYGELYNLL